MMSKVVVRTDDLDGFFARAKDAARRADQSQQNEEKVNLSFEDPQRMFTVLSQTRRRLMSEVMREPKTIKELTSRLHRNRSSVTKDVGMLEKMGLIVSSRQSNPGHGFQKVVQSIAHKIEMGNSGLAEFLTHSQWHLLSTYQAGDILPAPMTGIYRRGYASFRHVWQACAQLPIGVVRYVHVRSAVVRASQTQRCSYPRWRCTQLNFSLASGFVREFC